jgi:NADP-dependent aldehyde dehydrogenase
VTVVVWCEDEGEFLTAARRLPGSLTATLHAEPEDEGSVPELLSILSGRCGRVVYNGYPTGVAVTDAMHHGGPYPATTTAGHSSVGSTAIRRFLRPVAFQNLSHDLLPPALQDDNPLGIVRRVNGRLTTSTEIDS